MELFPSSAPLNIFKGEQLSTLVGFNRLFGAVLVECCNEIAKYEDLTICVALERLQISTTNLWLPRKSSMSISNCRAVVVGGFLASIEIAPWDAITTASKSQV